MRLLYDSVTAADIPPSAQLVAGYVSGPYAWSAADWARFPNAQHVGIATQANVNAGVVLDVESGDATPQQAPAWVAMRRKAGIDPTVYFSESNWGAVRAAFAAQGVGEPHYWIAAYDNVAQVPAGAVAKQYIDPPGSGGHYDLSVVVDSWPTPVTPPVPIQQPEESDNVAFWDSNSAPWQGNQNWAWVDTHGNLKHAWSNGGQAGETLASGLLPWSRVEFFIIYDDPANPAKGGAIELACLTADGRLQHFWQHSGSGVWGSEFLGTIEPLVGEPAWGGLTSAEDAELTDIQKHVDADLH